MNRRDWVVRACSLSAGLMIAAGAMAHGDHGKPRYGGVVAEGGVFQGELVVRDAAVTVFLVEHGKPLASAGASAKLTVLESGRTRDLTLAPAGENRLSADAGAALAKGTKAVASVRLADGRSAALRFELK